jgi:hypothetical protein
METKMALSLLLVISLMTCVSFCLCSTNLNDEKLKNSLDMLRLLQKYGDDMVDVSFISPANESVVENENAVEVQLHFSWEHVTNREAWETICGGLHPGFTQIAQAKCEIVLRQSLRDEGFEFIGSNMGFDEDDNNGETGAVQWTEVPIVGTTHSRLTLDTNFCRAGTCWLQVVIYGLMNREVLSVSDTTVVFLDLTTKSLQSSIKTAQSALGVQKGENTDEQPPLDKVDSSQTLEMLEMDDTELEADRSISIGMPTVDGQQEKPLGPLRRLLVLNIIGCGCSDRVNTSWLLATLRMTPETKVDVHDMCEFMFNLRSLAWSGRPVTGLADVDVETDRVVFFVATSERCLHGNYAAVEASEWRYLFFSYLRVLRHKPLVFHLDDECSGPQVFAFALYSIGSDTTRELFKILPYSSFHLPSLTLKPISLLAQEVRFPWYPLAARVYRQYYCGSYTYTRFADRALLVHAGQPLRAHVSTLPLVNMTASEVQQGFTTTAPAAPAARAAPAAPAAVKKRRYVWAFAGQEEADGESVSWHGQVESLVAQFEVVLPGQGVKRETAKTGDGDSALELYKSAWFALIGRDENASSLDCYRIYEALVAGAVPVVVGGELALRRDFAHLLSPSASATGQRNQSMDESLPWITAPTWTAAASRVAALVESARSQDDGMVSLQDLASRVNDHWRAFVGRFEAAVVADVESLLGD